MITEAEVRERERERERVEGTTLLLTLKMEKGGHDLRNAGGPRIWRRQGNKIPTWSFQEEPSVPTP